MRQVLVDYACRCNAANRGGGAVSLTPSLPADAVASSEHGLLEIHDALERLARLDPRAASVAEARLFGGTSIEEIGTSRGIAWRSVDGDRVLARRWLARTLSGVS